MQILTSDRNEIWDLLHLLNLTFKRNLPRQVHFQATSDCTLTVSCLVCKQINVFLGEMNGWFILAENVNAMGDTS